MKHERDMGSYFNKLSGIILEALFGKYLGIQVFIAPITMFYLIESDSIMMAGTSLLGFRIHFFPLFIFLVMLSFMAFMLIKLKLLHRGTRDDYLEAVIELNISMLALVIIALIVYAVAGFLAYFYGIKETLKHSMYMLFKIYTAVLILHHYLLSVWLAPFYPKHYGRKRAKKLFKAWARKHKMMLVRYSVLLILIVFASTRIYLILIHYVFVPVFTGIATYTGFDLRLSLFRFFALKDIFLNVAVCLIAFMGSNLLFSPVVWIIEYLINRFIPLKYISGIGNAKATQ